MKLGCSGFNQLKQTRRDFMRVGSLAGLGGLCLGDFYRAEGAQKWFDSKEGKAKSVIQIILPGGIAAQETWNPKPNAPLEYRGPLGFKDGGHGKKSRYRGSERLGSKNA